LKYFIFLKCPTAKIANDCTEENEANSRFSKGLGPEDTLALARANKLSQPPIHNNLDEFQITKKAINNSKKPVDKPKNSK
jgi:hypothetical protein